MGLITLKVTRKIRTRQKYLITFCFFTQSVLAIGVIPIENVVRFSCGPKANHWNSVRQSVVHCGYVIRQCLRHSVYRGCFNIQDMVSRGSSSPWLIQLPLVKPFIGQHKIINKNSKNNKAPYKRRFLSGHPHY